MNEPTTQVQQHVLFDDVVEEAVSKSDTELAQVTGGSATEVGEKQNDSQITESKASEAVETVTFDMSSKEGVLKCVDSALDNLEQALNQGHSEGLKNYLKFLSGFHSYSFRNIMLIFMQNPDATLVAGYKAWQKIGRQVRKGETGLRILAPMVRKRKTDETEQSKAKSGERSDDKTKTGITGFRMASVFDVSQTEGNDLPELGGYSGDPAENLDRLMEFAAIKGIKVLMENPGGGALGVSQGGTIKVRPDLSPTNIFAVLVHEVAHELLHKGERRSKTTVSIRETEAEAVAYAVCSAVGLDGHSQASDYIQLHQGDSEKFRQSLEVIRKTASDILQALESEQ